MEEDSNPEESKDFVKYREGNFDTDIGSLDPVPINPKYRDFSV